MPKPLLQAMLLADHVYQDKETGKKIIAGTFNSLSISKTKVPPKEPGQAAAGQGVPPPGVQRGPADAAASGAAGESPMRSTAEPSTAGAAAGKPPQDAAKSQQNVPPHRPLTAAEISRLGNPTAFISLTEIRGPMDLELRYVDLTDQNSLMTLKFRVFSDDPLKTVEAILPVPPLPTPHPGVYAMELLWQGEPLGSLRITAIEVPPPGTVPPAASV